VVRDIIVTLAVAAMLPSCFRKPYVGLLVFSWLAYMRVQDLCWGFARGMRFSMFVAIAMFSGFFVFEPGRFFQKDLRNGLMLVLAVLVTVSIITTPYKITDYVVTYYFEFVKILAVAMFTTAIVNTQQRLRTLVWTVALSLGFFGVKSGVWGVLTGGGTAILRGPGGLLQDNNDFSLALTMNLPFLFYLGLSEPNKWVRRGCFGAMGLTVITILLTHSRGGFLAMAATLALMTWRSRNRVIGFALAGVGVVLFLVLAPQGVMERLSSMKKYEDDSSARARFKSWGIALHIIRDHPIVGIGFRNYQPAYMEYDPDPALRGDTQISYVAHNSYLQIAAESGLPAFGVYMAIFGSTLILLRRVRYLALARDATAWILNYVRMFEATIVGFLVGAVFLNRAHFDFAYHVVSIVVAFALIAQNEMLSEEAYPLRARAVGHVVGPTGFAAAGLPDRRDVPLGHPELG